VSFEYVIRVAGDRLTIAVPGTLWHEEIANTVLVEPSLKGPGGVIHGVGTYAADLRADLAKSEAEGRLPHKARSVMGRLCDICPFPEGPLTVEVTEAALWHFAERSWSETPHRWRELLAHIWDGRMVIRLDYPGWIAVPTYDRGVLLDCIAERNHQIRELWVNGRMLVKRRSFRSTWKASDP
jgi:hypothetical protein